jgi:cytochrome c oxidase subunit 2
MWDFPLLAPAASKQAHEIDLLFWVLTALTVLFTFIVFAGVIVLVVRYRANSKVDRSNAPHHDMRLELIWSVIPGILAFAIFFWAAKLYGDMYTPPKDGLEIFVVGKQWMWHAQHPNGVRENNELHVPTGVSVKITAISQDVIHAFSIPAFRTKRDIVPGRYNQMWFEPNRPGKYRLFCTEYCGTKHSEMVGWAYVMEPDKYQKWLEQGGSSGSTTASGSMEEQGKQVFTQLGCAACHGNKTSAVKCPPVEGIYGKKVQLVGGKTITVDENYIRESILNPSVKVVAGYEGPNNTSLMTPYQGVASEDQIMLIIAYIKSLANEKPQE